jgi:hypothetical protein
MGHVAAPRTAENQGLTGYGDTQRPSIRIRNFSKEHDLTVLTYLVVAISVGAIGLGVYGLLMPFINRRLRLFARRRLTNFEQDHESTSEDAGLSQGVPVDGVSVGESQSGAAAWPDGGLDEVLDLFRETEVAPKAPPALMGAVEEVSALALLTTAREVRDRLRAVAVRKAPRAQQ